MLRREMGCSSRGTIRGSVIGGHCTNARTELSKPLRTGRLRADSRVTIVPMHLFMRYLAASALSVTLGAPNVKAADDPLARARLLYNQKQFTEAINAAELARHIPTRADAADLVAARAYLERFRESSASDDRTNAPHR